MQVPRRDDDASAGRRRPLSSLSPARPGPEAGDSRVRTRSIEPIAGADSDRSRDDDRTRARRLFFRLQHSFHCLEFDLVHPESRIFFKLSLLFIMFRESNVLMKTA